MTPDKWQQVKEILDKVLALPVADRQGFIAHRAGHDSEIIAEVLSLLPFYEDASSGTESVTLDELLNGERLAFPISATLEGTRVGHYELRQRLGAGGMGEIYLAERVDDDFQQKVAIKFIRRHLVNEDFLAHFRQEKQILASLVHDHIAHLFDAGTTDDGWPYIVMEYVQGRPVHEFCTWKDLDIRARIGLFRLVCSAVHSAHQSQVIHRDIKPHNILVTDEGSPKLLDFGIAWISNPQANDCSNPELQAMTPEYAAPEQFLGQKVTTATDIYSLGVLLYRLLTHRMPHLTDGKNLNQIREIVLNTAPTPPSEYEPQIRPELEAILLKCLEKDPQNRYGSARALEEDLRRILDCEPISIWSHRFTYVLKTNIRKNRVSVAIGTFGLICLSLVLGWSVWQQYLARERERMVLLFSQEAERIEARARYAYMLPTHDIRSSLASLKLEMLHISEDMASKGGERYARAALGRGHLAIGDTEKARVFLQKAWEDGFHDSRVAYALALCLVDAYQDSLEDLERLARIDREDGATLRSQINRELLAPALFYLEQAQNASIEEAGYATALSAFNQAFVDETASNQAIFEDALEKARLVTIEVPWLFEAYRLQGHILMARGNDQRDRGDYRGAISDFEMAGAALEQAARIAPSFTQVWTDLGYLAQKRMQLLQIGHGGDVSPHYVAGLKWCEMALVTDPGSNQAHRIRSLIFQRMAQYALSIGENPEEYLTQAILAAEQAMALSEKGSSDIAYALQVEGSGWHALANFEKSVGRDPRDSYNKGIEAYQQVVIHLPRYVNYNALGLMYRAVSEFEQDSGQDPVPSLEKAEEAFKNAISVSPDSSGAHVNLSLLYWNRALNARQLGQDPLPWFDLAIHSGRRALEINPNKTSAYNNMALGLAFRGDYLRSLGRDGRADMLEAVKAYGRAIEINPRREPIAGLAESRYFLALDAWDRGADPMPDLEKAVEANQKCLKLVSGYHFALENQGKVLTLLARLTYAQGQDPKSVVEQAHSCFQQINSGKSSYFASRVSAAQLHLFHAETLVATHQNPDLALKRATDALTQARQSNPLHWQVSLLDGRLHTLRALTEPDRGRALLTWNEGQALLRDAQSVAPFELEVPLAQAEQAMAFASWQLENDPQQVLATVATGETCLKRLRELNPNLARAGAISGVFQLLSYRITRSPKQLEAALSQLNPALENNGFLRREFAGWLEEVEMASRLR